MNRNEERADRALRAIDAFSDRNHSVDGELVSGMYLDVSDLMADMLHLCDRYGIEHDDVINKATDSYAGDGEDGPRVERVVFGDGN